MSHWVDAQLMLFNHLFESHMVHMEFDMGKVRGLLFLFRDEGVLDRGISKGLSDLSFFFRF